MVEELLVVSLVNVYSYMLAAVFPLIIFQLLTS